MAAQRQASAALLATSVDRDERQHATTPKNRAQVRGRASGVRCTQCWAALVVILRMYDAIHRTSRIKWAENLNPPEY